MDFIENVFQVFFSVLKWIAYPSSSNPLIYAFGVFVFNFIVIKMLFGLLRGGKFHD